jgi:hypothetical protein
MCSFAIWSGETGKIPTLIKKSLPLSMIRMQAFVGHLGGHQNLSFVNTKMDTKPLSY